MNPGTAVNPIDPTLWAQTGGLNGLVIMALFLLIYIFIKSISKILDNHRADLSGLLDLHAKEREEWGKIVDARQRETNAAISAMATALNKMVSRHRHADEDNL